MLLLTMRMRNRSHRASSPSPWAGSSLLAAIRSFNGSLISRLPLRKIFSLSTVRREFWMAGPAFQISSRKTTSALGRYPSVIRSYCSLSLSLAILTGPNTSSGVEKRDIRYSKELASLNTFLIERAIMDFATPGGPRMSMLSPAIAANRASLSSHSLSYTPLLISATILDIFSGIVIIDG